MRGAGVSPLKEREGLEEEERPLRSLSCLLLTLESGFGPGPLSPRDGVYALSPSKNLAIAI